MKTFREWLNEDKTIERLKELLVKDKREVEDDSDIDDSIIVTGKKHDYRVTLERGKFSLYILDDSESGLEYSTSDASNMANKIYNYYK